jgi:hypothetical protein
MNRTTFITALIIIFMTSIAAAQQEQMGRKTAEQRTELITKEMTKNLVLDTRQTEGVRELVLKGEKFRDAGKLSVENQKKIESDINKLLTKDQQKQWSQIRKADKDKKTD